LYGAFFACLADDSTLFDTLLAKPKITLKLSKFGLFHGLVAVMFTFSFSTAFAALDADVVTDLKLYTTEMAQKLYYGEGGKIDDLRESYLNMVTYDAYGYVNNMAEFNGYATKAQMEALFEDMADYAELAFANAVAGFTYAEGQIDSKGDVLVALEGALDTAEAAVMDEYKNGSFTNWFADKYVNAVIKETFEAEKTAALAAIGAINPENYSDNLDDWSKVGSYISGLVGTAAELGVSPSVTYTAKGYVEAILAKQTADITAATATTSGIDTVRLAKKYATQAILGHKIEAAPNNYYIEAVPTIADLKADTSLDGAKTAALAQIKAALASKQVEMTASIQGEIKELNKYSKLSDAQKLTLAALNEELADLPENFANYEEVATAMLGYETTTAGVTSLKNLVLAEIDLFDDTDAYFTETTKRVDNVKALKAEAALLEAQKDVNGQPYIDAAVLAANLEDAIEMAYKGTAYATCKAELAGGTEEALIEAKIAYIKFIKGTDTFATNPKDSKGYTIVNPWMTTTTANGGATIAVLDSYVDGVTKMYDKAQRAELKALVTETEAAIKAAKTIAEVKAIFVAANDKYEDIATTDDHQASWLSGKLYAAYVKAEYEKDLEAYAGYFVAKTDMDKYPDAVDTAAEIMNAVAYPIVYSAYTVEELPAKVAEAKAAIDAMKTTAQIKIEKAAVEAAIKALPAVSAITTADKAAIVAAADMLDAYDDIPGYIAIVNESVLTAAEAAYEAAAADEIDAAYKVLAAKKAITTADEDAIEALRAAYDAHMTYCATYGPAETVTPVANDIVALEEALSDAKVAAAKTLMINLPVNPATADKAAVEAARAAYEDLTLAEKLEVVDTLAYDNLIDAEEALGLAAEADKAELIASVEGLKIKASSKATKGAITVKWTVDEEVEGVKYQVYKSTKAHKGYKKSITTTKTSFKNTKNIKKGTRYFYKVRAIVEVEGVKYYSDWSNKANRIAK